MKEWKSQNDFKFDTSVGHSPGDRAASMAVKGLKCSALHSYAGTVSSHDGSLHSTSRNGSKPSEDTVWLPMWQVIQNKLHTLTQWRKGNICSSAEEEEKAVESDFFKLSKRRLRDLKRVSDWL